MVKKTVTKTTKTVIDDGKTKKTIHKKITTDSKKKKTHKKVVKKKTAKKSTKKVVNKTAKKKTSAKKSAPKMSVDKRDEVLVENFVGLQHAMTNLSIKFGEMSQNISKLLTVFETAAKDLAKTEKQVDASFENKLDSLIDQNKTIAKGLVLMDGKLKNQMARGPTPEQRVQPPIVPRLAPQGSTASVPMTPAISHAPVVPQSPGVPQVPVAPQVPATPQLPVTPAAPQASAVPGVPQLPQPGQPSFPPVASNKPKPLPQL